MIDLLTMIRELWHDKVFLEFIVEYFWVAQVRLFERGCSRICMGAPHVAELQGIVFGAWAVFYDRVLERHDVALQALPLLRP